MRFLPYFFLLLGVSLANAWQTEPSLRPTKSPDDQILIDTSSDQISLFERETLERKFVIEGSFNPRLFSPDGRILIYSNPKLGLFSLNLETGQTRNLSNTPYITAIAISEDGSQLISTSAWPDTYASESIQVHRIATDGQSPPELLSEIKPDTLKWYDQRAFLISKNADKAILVAQEYGPTNDIYDPKEYGDYVFTEISLIDGSSQRLSSLSKDKDLGYFTGGRWVDETRTTLEETGGYYLLLDPYAGKIIRRIDLPNVSFLFHTEGQILARRTVEEEGSEKYFHDYLQSGSLKTIRNVEVQKDDRGHWPSPEESAEPPIDFPQAPQAFTYDNLAFHPSKPEFFAMDIDENVYFYRATRSGLQFQARGQQAFWAQHSPDGEQVFFERLYDAPTEQVATAKFPSNEGITYQEPPLKNADPVYASPPLVSPSGKWLIKINNRAATLHKFGEPPIVSTLSSHNGNYNAPQQEYRFASDEKALYRIIYNYSWEGDSLVGLPFLEALAFDPSDNYPAEKWSIELPERTPVWLDPVVGPSVRMLDISSGKRLSFDSQTGALTSTSVTGFDPDLFLTSITDTEFSPSGEQLFLACGKNLITVSQDEQGAHLKAQSLASEIQSLHRYGDQRHLVAQLSTGPLVFLDMDRPDLPITLTLKIYGSESGAFLAYTPNGQFDATSSIMDSGFLVQGTRPIPLNTIAARSHEPGLMAKTLGENAVAADESLQEYIQPPSITAKDYWESAMSRKIIFHSVSQQYGLDEVTLYQNGKLIDSISGEEKSELRGEFKVDLLLEENRFELVAINTEGVSRRSELIVVNPPEALIEEARAAQRPAELHILAVGVDQYRNSEYNLNYAEADASAILDKIETANRDLFAKIHQHHLKSSAATRSGILQAFETVRATALPHDVFVFYFAGHGVMSKENNQFYLVPHDVTRIYGDSQSLTENGISADQLRNISASIKAQKQLFVLDACNSGGALQAFTQRGASQEKAVAQLARATGTHWITASADDQFATEFADLGHGAFTYTLLKAIDGEADSGDRRVTVNELKAYLESELPEITKKHKGSPQYPASYGSGQDFPIALLP
ncbi:caspase family protein [Coraliomargarita sp. SDUM461004]|uniref:Caspase family protein n=1 Tax=Thalassobacterium sedimentorum TaxID=3041258 RepID=A0ABU1AEP6_9BACT|nr:caspase family protein [Coraliomargarita sp. SDUM461004]MDQ8193262.1 caspase family protein [Coraliomargarita sp. SDUM461004]